MSLFDDLHAITLIDERMALHTSFGVGGEVSYFITPRSWAELELAHDRSRAAGLRVRVLGRGSNILVTDEYHCCAVISTEALVGVARTGLRVDAGAGLALPRLLAAAEAWGLGGFEPLAGIPGSVGGAVAMNAGGRHGTIGERLVGAMVACPDAGVRWVEAGDLGLSYRGSSVVEGSPVVLSATFELERAAPRGLQARRRSITAEKRAAQPMGARSAGCVFKNPPGQSAGRLIDQACLKGTSVGDAAVSHKHANFIVNRGKARASDILDLIGLVRDRVLDRFGVCLELEIEIWAPEESTRSA